MITLTGIRIIRKTNTKEIMNKNNKKILISNIIKQVKIKINKI